MSNILVKPLEAQEAQGLKVPQLLCVGLDIHKDTHWACLINCWGQKVLDLEIRDALEDYERLVNQVSKASKEQGLFPLFGLEAGYGYGQRIATYLKKQGFEVKVVSPVLVDRKRKYETHPEKSDSLDALGVARVLLQRSDSLPSFTIAHPDRVSKEIKELVLDRESQVKEQTRLKNQLHSLLHRTYGSSYKELFKNPFSLKALKHWKRCPLDRKLAKQGLICHQGALKDRVRRKIKRLLVIRKELKEVEKELEALIRQAGQRLETLPGCKIVLAAQVLAEIRNIDRFSSASALAKYAGLSPRERSSGKKRRHIKTLSGNRRLNKALHQIALSEISRYGNQYAKEYFQRKVAEGKSKAQALCCLKRRLVNIIFAMLKKGEEYNYSG